MDGSRSHKRRRQESPARNSNSNTNTTTNHNVTNNNTNNTNNNNSPCREESESSTNLAFLVLSKSWRAAEKRARAHPHEATYGCTSRARMPLHLYGGNSNGNGNPNRSHDNHPHNHNDIHNNNNNINSQTITYNNTAAMASSPLAIACRYGAPPNTVQAILEADRHMVRRCIPNRGTPLHEAIMNPTISNSNEEPCANNNGSASGNANSNFDYVETIRMLLEADEQLEQICASHEPQLNQKWHGQRRNISKRATLMQDVDGNVPLHLLIRQGFYNYLHDNTTNSHSNNNTNNTTNPNQLTQEHPLLTIIHDLIRSCPSASAQPDCTEFEETPLVLVLKSSIHTADQAGFGPLPTPPPTTIASESTANESTNAETFSSTARLEQRIFEMSKVMLKAHPYAASFVSSRSGYTAVHSAVFHGRCCDTIRLLLDADCKYRRQIANANSNVDAGNSDSSSSHSDNENHHKNNRPRVPISAAMRANRFGETPLHFATMRGECTRTIDLLSRAAPWAVLKRDGKFGMTPLHWLMARFVDVMYERFEQSFDFVDGGDTADGDGDVDVDTELDSEDGFDGGVQTIVEGDHHDGQEMNEIIHGAVTTDCELNGESSVPNDGGDRSSITINGGEEDTFDLEYHKRTGAIDPPVDYMRMRHILPDHNSLQDALTDRVIHVLRRVRRRHQRIIENAQSVQSCPFKKDSDPIGHTKMKHIKSCPFKNDSYPIGPGLMGSEEETVVREEQAISLFWAKASSLLGAAAVAQQTCESDVSNLQMSVSIPDEGNHVSMLHSACSAPSPLAIVRLCAALYPEQLLRKDSTGKLPLHHAACRVWDVREICSNSSCPGESAANLSASMSSGRKIISNESAKVLELILNLSSPHAAGVFDNEGRLPFHHAIDSALKVIVDRQYGEILGRNNCSSDDGDGNEDNTLFSVMDALRMMVRVKPDTIEEKDGRTGLFPFMQASAGASEKISRYVSSEKSNKLTLSMTYSLLLENPSLATVGFDY